MDWFDNDDLFFAELLEGRKWEEFVAHKLQEAGYSVELPHFHVNYGKRERRQKEFVGSHDLRVEGCLCEVKSRNYPFFCPFTFPFTTVMLETVSSYEGKQNKPDIYITVSKPTGEFILYDARGKGPEDWQVKEFYDAKRKVSDKAYVVPRHHFKSLKTKGEKCLHQDSGISRRMGRRSRASRQYSVDSKKAAA